MDNLPRVLQVNQLRRRDLGIGCDYNPGNEIDSLDNPYDRKRLTEPYDERRVDLLN